MTCILKQMGDICFLNSICQLSCHTSTIYARCSTHLYLYPENVSNLVKTKFIDRYEDMHKKYVEMQTKWI